MCPLPKLYIERSLYGIDKSAQSADRFIGGGTNVTFELGNETFYRLIKLTIKLHRYFLYESQMNKNV